MPLWHQSYDLEVLEPIGKGLRCDLPNFPQISEYSSKFVKKTWLGHFNIFCDFPVDSATGCKIRSLIRQSPVVIIRCTYPGVLVGWSLLGETFRFPLCLCLWSVCVPRDVICFLKAMTKTFLPDRKNTYLPFIITSQWLVATYLSIYFPQRTPLRSDPGDL